MTNVLRTRKGESIDTEAHAALLRAHVNHRHVEIRVARRGSGKIGVVVSVASLEAAEAAEDDLYPLAGIARETWSRGWRFTGNRLEIDLSAAARSAFAAEKDEEPAA